MGLDQQPPDLGKNPSSPQSVSAETDTVDLEQAKKESELINSQVMDSMEEKAGQGDIKIAEFGSKISVRGQYEDNRFIILAEPIMQEATADNGREAIRKPAFFAMTRLGPKIIIPADRVQEEELKKIIERQTASHIEKSDFSKPSSIIEVTSEDMGLMRSNRNESRILAKKKALQEGLQSDGESSSVFLGMTDFGGLVVVAEGMKTLRGSIPMMSTDSNTFIDALRVSEEAAARNKLSDSKLPETQQSSAQQRTSDAKNLLSYFRPQH